MPENRRTSAEILIPAPYNPTPYFAAVMQTKIETPREWPRLKEALDLEVVKRADE